MNEMSFYEILYIFCDFQLERDRPTDQPTDRASYRGAPKKRNKWRGVTTSLRTGGQEHPTPIHTQTPPPYILKMHLNGFLPHFQLRARDPMTHYVSWMDGPLVGQSHLAFFCIYVWFLLLPKYLFSFGSHVSSLVGFVLTNPQTYGQTKQLRMAKWAKTCPIFLSGWPNKL